MRYLIIGAVAAGTSAATEIRRKDKSAKIIIYEKNSFISYASCGIPYYLSGETSNINDLAPRDTLFFKQKHEIEILTNHEVLSIEADNKSIIVKNRHTGDIFNDSYDALILATGASAISPRMKGIEMQHVFKLRTLEDALNINSFITEKKPKKAAIIGTGLVGLEMCECFTKLGIQTTLIARSTVAKSIDRDLTVYIEEHLRANGVEVLTNAPTTEITKEAVVLDDGRTVSADMVLLSTGIKANIDLAQTAGAEIGQSGAIKVDNKMRTSVDGIYACGDCVELFHLLSGAHVYRPLGSTANKTGVVAGSNAAGSDDSFPGILGTGIFRVFDLSIAQTGLSEKEAKDSGFDAIVCLDKRLDKPSYMGGKYMYIKSVAEKPGGRLLGAQILGYDGVDKRIDVFAALIASGANIKALINLDLSYAPPYSTPRDPLYYTGIKLLSKLD